MAGENIAMASKKQLLRILASDILEIRIDGMNTIIYLKNKQPIVIDGGDEFHITFGLEQFNPSADNDDFEYYLGIWQ
jgi:hypothetical protein